VLTNPSFIKSPAVTTSPDFFLQMLKAFTGAVFQRYRNFMPQYFIFHKPFRVLSQFSAEGEKKTLADYFHGLPKNIYPVGRLDYDSEGLLLLTDDKPLTHRLLDPSFAHPRTYWVQVEGMITENALQKLADGVMINIDGKQYHTKKAIAKILPAGINVSERNPPVRFRKNIPTSWIALTLFEGKNRQVRKMTAAVNFPTLRLIRHAIGNVTIDGIAPGEYQLFDESVKDLLLTQE